MTGCLFVYVTTPTHAEAETLARAAVEERLAACANILPAMTSLYRWQGKIEEGREAVLILKTRAALFDALTARLKTLHPAECPCIVALPLVAGEAGFLRWIGDETQK